MSIQLNHTIVWCSNKQRSAAFLTGLLGLPKPTMFGSFLVVELDNGVSLDFHEREGAIAMQHYAFLIGEDDFDRVFDRLRERGLDHWADPGKKQPAQINHHDGGRGMYFDDPNGHLLEVITRPLIVAFNRNYSYQIFLIKDLMAEKVKDSRKSAGNLGHRS